MAKYHDTRKCTQVLDVKCMMLFSDFNETRIWSTIFKRFQCKISRNSVRWSPSCCMRTWWFVICIVARCNLMDGFLRFGRVDDKEPSNHVTASPEVWDGWFGLHVQTIACLRMCRVISKQQLKNDWSSCMVDFILRYCQRSEPSGSDTEKLITTRLIFGTIEYFGPINVCTVWRTDWFTSCSFDHL
jgi:hypothetical protein